MKDIKILFEEDIGYLPISKQVSFAITALGIVLLILEKVLRSVED